MEAFSKEDLPALKHLSEEAGWDQTTSDWEAILETGYVCGPRDRSGTPTACGALFDYGPALCALGMLLVTSSQQKKGVGKKIMEHLLDRREPKGKPVMLVAGSRVKEFYEKLGFREVERIHKLQAPPKTAPPVSTFSLQQSIQPIQEQDLVPILSVDQQVLGANRSDMLRTRCRQSAQTLRITNPHGTLLGYGMGFAEAEDAQLFIGPLIAFNRFSALDLISAMMNAHNGGPVRIDVSSRREDLVQTLMDAGFQELDTQPVMVKDAPSLPGKRDHLFALASQAWG
ncbi:GNAT family N-acetyltransferase [Nitrospina watsonii]|uniref:N-acetyltransferase domain-containing protein n=1 Tax=Nitrospina watsonii TaxID=1323948 RepID=A0ABM9HA08_9BACT|nr:GNAT family N-acetyltransferase [Nitrospina watsonii]CAI2716951.1 N-acetyltransferase domain-containing protein [Nitrospina watsonii]